MSEKLPIFCPSCDHEAKWKNVVGDSIQFYMQNSYVIRGVERTVCDHCGFEFMTDVQMDYLMAECKKVFVAPKSF